MAPRKEPKEQIVYPSSKRKTPAFKPLRPSKVPRIPTTESESSARSRPATKKVAPKKPATAAKSIALSDSEDDENDLDDLAKADGMDGSDDDLATLEDDPLAGVKRPRSMPAPKATKPTAAQRPGIREPSPMSISSDRSNEPPAQNLDQEASQSDSTPSVPQALLLRLLHESFTDKTTKIDTQAIQVFHKYIEVFVREAIATTKLEKEQAAARGEVAEAEVGWLELEDLEKVAPRMLMDF